MGLLRYSPFFWMQGRFPLPLVWFCKLAVYIGCSLFLSVRPECWEASLHPHMFILFRAAEKETHCPREHLPMPIFSSKRIIYICYSLFLSVRPECRDVSLWPSVIHSFSYRRKRTNQEKGGRPKLPFLWECPSLLNGRNSLRSNKRPFFTKCHPFSLCGIRRTTSHSRNGAAWEQMQSITDDGMLRKPRIIQSITHMCLWYFCTVLFLLLCMIVYVLP